MNFRKYDYIQKRDTNLKNDLTLKHLYNYFIGKNLWLK
jgi:hypothetical protein